MNISELAHVYLYISIVASHCQRKKKIILRFAVLKFSHACWSIQEYTLLILPCSFHLSPPLPFAVIFFEEPSLNPWMQ